MKQDIKERWVAALRSGEYEQTRGKLRKKDQSGHQRYCCLGVLCEIVKDEIGLLVTEGTGRDEGTTFYDGCTAFPPASVLNYVGEDFNLLKVRLSNGPVGLYVLNDTYKWDFDQIADAIEGGL